MKHLISIFKTKVLLYFIIIFCGLNVTFGQTLSEKKMEHLQFMIGEWIGISTKIERDSVIKEVPAFESIAYKLDQNIITLDLQSESLQLHTVIYYDEKDSTYYYCPYYKEGAGKYKAEFSGGKFLVWFNERRRLTFHMTTDGSFQEYGENLIYGKWNKYFEDTFKKGA